MNKLRYWSVILSCLLALPTMQAREFVGVAGQQQQQNSTNNGSYRNNCTESRAQTDLAINNVRALLRAGGDMWWDGNSNARYIVPNVDPASGIPEISSLFAGAIWLGAYDDGGNLILAAQTYRSNGNDYWTGPLDPNTGTTQKTDCERWDKHFTVFGADINALRGDYLDPLAPGVQNTPSLGLLGWPGKGNPNFAAIHGFDIRNYNQDLAPFVDANADGIYNPYDGDHPIIEVTGCEDFTYNNPVYADQMTWWVYNDNGNLHTQTNGQAMKMEVQVTAFGYVTTDAVNNMTFYRYKLLNRNALALNDTYFSLWTDPDLGCANDDYIGCDTVTGMGYVYNQDANDDNPCGTGGSAGYGANIPALGVDYFRGPLDSAGAQIGLSSFQYHVNNNTPIGDPTSALGFYRLISGFWPNGTPITAGGNGYDPGAPAGTVPTPYVFPSFPDQQGGGAWSMCSEGLSGLDQRFLHTSGPFVLKPGATNEMISGVVWVPDVPDYPCPSLSSLVSADELAQTLFDDCFKITDGPDAPFMEVVEMDQKLVLNLYYDATSNNFRLGYEESPSKLALEANLAGVTNPDTTYNFQGYKIYQVNDPNLSVTELGDETKARLIYQTDVEDGISKIANWSIFTDPDLGISGANSVAIPEIQVEGEDKGIKHTFSVVEDQFAKGEKDLINHKPYYFCVVAYAHNEFLKYNPITKEGQKDAYLQGRRNFKIYTAIPRINDPEYAGVALNSAYGDRPGITRLDGNGTGSGRPLEIANLGSIESDILNGNNVGEIVYTGGKAPIDVKIVDPLRVPAGTFYLHVCDQSYLWSKDASDNYVSQIDTATNLSDSTYWALTDSANSQVLWTSFQTMEWNTEQYIPDLGISVIAQQTSKPSGQGEQNIGNVTGWVGAEIVYADSTTYGKWYEGVEDGEGVFNMIKNGANEDDILFDPNKEYSTNEGGWYPFMLNDGELRTTNYYFSLMNIGTTGSRFRNASSSIAGKVRDTLLASLNNVNIVLTQDRSKWSRCIVTETANRYHGSGYLGQIIPSGRKQMEWKGSPSSATKPTYYSRNKDMSIDSSSTGMSWFPGYAYDVETGQRLNIFFGENSLYNGVILEESLNPGSNTGNDMIFNPTSTRQTGPFSTDENVQFLRSVLGGQHIVYVTRQPYDECQSMIDLYQNIVIIFDQDHKIIQSMDVTWASMALLGDNVSMQGTYGELPPTDATVKLRVDRPHNIERGTYENAGYPKYKFSLDGFSPAKENGEVSNTALDLLGVVPNPYYAYSDYEIRDDDNVVKVTNVPADCNIRIYSLDGRFVREYTTPKSYENTPTDYAGQIARVGLGTNGGQSEDQIITSVNWDLKNYAGVPVASGVYLIHVKVNGVGSRVLKSFIINRAFDAQRL